MTISGLPGSGTSTVAHLVASALGLERVDGGAVFRAMAAERGMDVAAFSAVAESDPTIDVDLDRRLSAIARAGNVVLESRLAGWIARNEGVPATRVWLDAGAAERARRVATREGIDAAAALAANQAREASEARRYQLLYGISIADRSIYDLVIDTTDLAPDAIAKSIVAAATR